MNYIFIIKNPARSPCVFMRIYYINPILLLIHWKSHFHFLLILRQNVLILLYFWNLHCVIWGWSCYQFSFNSSAMDPFLHVLKSVVKKPKILPDFRAGFYRTNMCIFYKLIQIKLKFKMNLKKKLKIKVIKKIYIII